MHGFFDIDSHKEVGTKTPDDLQFMAFSNQERSQEDAEHQDPAILTVPSGSPGVIFLSMLE